MSRYWVRNQVTDALERNPSCHGVPARYSKMSDEVGIMVDLGFWRMTEKDYMG